MAMPITAIPGDLDQFLSQFAFFCCDKTLTKSNLGKKGLCHQTGYSQSLREVRTGIHVRNLQAGTEIEAMLLPGLLSVADSVSFLRTICTGVEPLTFSVLGPPILTIDQENALKTYLYAI